MNNVDEIGTLQENKELDNLINSQEMKDLDDLMGAIEEDREHYYTEIFDTLMYEQVAYWSVSFNDFFRTVWKRRELEEQEGQELQRGNLRTRWHLYKH